MNSWKLNGRASSLTRQAICKCLNIKHSEIYKAVKEINGDIIVTQDGSKYCLTLTKIE